MNEKYLTKAKNEELGVDVECSLSLPTTNELEVLIEQSKKRLSKYSDDIDKTLFDGDNIDLIVAASSGFFCGLMDAVFLSNIDLAKCQSLGQSAVEPIIKIMGGSNDLTKAVLNLEKRTKKGFASDPNLNDFGGGLQHHLRDMAHHFSPLGLFFSLLTQFTGKCYGFNTAGKFIATNVVDKTRIGSSLGQKLANASVDWFFHLASDMMGTSKTIGRGTGIPGPMLSTAKELSALFPAGKDGKNEMSVLVSKMFNGSLFADHDINGKIVKGTERPLDFTSELGMSIFQSIPVLLNVTFVRIFYLVRRLIVELRNRKQTPNYKVRWKDLFPFGNSTIIRMTTIANCTFSAVDLSCAIVTSAIKSGGTLPVFITNMVLNVNFAGLGRMCLSFGEEAFIGVRRHSLEKKKSKELTRLALLYQSKAYIKQGELWLEIADTEKSMKSLQIIYEESAKEFGDYLVSMQSNLDKIDNNLQSNKNLADFILNKLEQ